MIINKKQLKLSQICALVAYYGFAQYLPKSHTFSNIGGGIRTWLCKFIFLKIGKGANVERRAHFGSGKNIVLGNNSGLGINCNIPSDTIIGDNVMMGPNCFVIGLNHSFERTDIPMIKQGTTHAKQTIIEDDVWIGRNVTMTPGRHISRGTIIAACCVLTKDFPNYSIVGGNPSILIRSRINDSNEETVNTPK